MYVETFDDVRHELKRLEDRTPLAAGVSAGTLAVTVVVAQAGDWWVTFGARLDAGGSCQLTVNGAARAGLEGDGHCSRELSLGLAAGDRLALAGSGTADSGFIRVERQLL